MRTAGTAVCAALQCWTRFESRFLPGRARRWDLEEKRFDGEWWGVVWSGVGVTAIGIGIEYEKRKKKYQKWSAISLHDTSVVSSSVCLIGSRSLYRVVPEYERFLPEKEG